MQEIQKEMKKAYTLYNKELNKKLMHPKIGLWYTFNLDEAKAALKDCHEYLDYSGLGVLKDNFVIIDVETSEEI
jgi:hypothetical protein